jgi:hypothetical protein
MLRRNLIGAALAAPAFPRALRAAEPVDVELVLALDVSRSIDPAEQELQFRGYEAAFRDPRLAEGIAAGPVGAIAVSLFTWSDYGFKELLVPWRRLDGAPACQALAGVIARLPRRTQFYTSISGAMDFAATLFGQRYEGTRLVLDISGDGINNHGPDVAPARAAALAAGITINGLAVLDGEPAPVPLAEYYESEVIGGPGAFLVVAEGFTAFEAAVRRKIIREIAAAPPAGARVERAFA